VPVEAERNRWRRKAERLEVQNDELKAALEEARRAAKRQAAPFARRKRKKHPKSPGRPEGHPAANRPLPDRVDEEVHVPLEACPFCHGGVEQVRDLKPQVVIDVSAPPDAHKQVRRFYNQSGFCPRCRRWVQSRDPDQCSTARGAAGVQIGPQLSVWWYTGTRPISNSAVGHRFQDRLLPSCGLGSLLSGHRRPSGWGDIVVALGEM
jgi:transposase